MKFLQDTTIACCNFYCNSLVCVQTVLSIACYMFGLFTKTEKIYFIDPTRENSVFKPPLKKKKKTPTHKKPPTKP